ncbi:Aspartyl/glutamyl-tRNA(Asn/Gln) amidotransferase subunit B [Frankliniella fusca]|uniref:Aspartyl/glutamyl-tRNA(Asn/Gln) amidotransferase subunit B n=1 Tax=Frankliniella fusca TaxID=407009 RepID=A0AAE1LS50_9NEOP|nr:Aspartyl/glutamyl-tRNA(Asn/Gln) amidotransferase subunit B [Frankliniella fusca]
MVLPSSSQDTNLLFEFCCDMRGGMQRRTHYESVLSGELEDQLQTSHQAMYSFKPTQMLALKQTTLCPVPAAAPHRENMCYA